MLIRMSKLPIVRPLLVGEVETGSFVLLFRSLDSAVDSNSLASGLITSKAGLKIYK